MRTSSNPRLVTPEERESFRNGHAEGLTIGAIAAALQAGGYPVRSYFSYVAIAKDLRLSLRGRIDRDRPWTDDEDIRLRAWTAADLSDEIVARRFERTINSCATRAQALGIRWQRRESSDTHSQPDNPARQTQALALANCRPWGPATKLGRFDLGAPAA